MSKQVLISLLSKGNTGSEILSILDALTSETVSDTEQANVPTLDVIEFWWYSGSILDSLLPLC